MPQYLVSHQGLTRLYLHMPMGNLEGLRVSTTHTTRLRQAMHHQAMLTSINNRMHRTPQRLRKGQ